MREMPPADFAEMLRTAMREDEWLLYLHGAVLGFGAGLHPPGDLRMSFDDDTGEPAGPRRAPTSTGQQALEELLQAAPGLARIAANMARQGASEIANAYVEGASRVMRAASQGESTADAVQETAAELRAYLRELIGVEESTRSRPTGDSSADALRSRGEELLRRSADVSVDVDSHPAYVRILDALAPDEARILRFLAREGEQPSVDVRAGPAVIASELVAPGLHDDRRGGRLPARRPRPRLPQQPLPARARLVLARGRCATPARYQVLEAQPEVTEALREGPGAPHAPCAAASSSPRSARTSARSACRWSKRSHARFELRAPCVAVLCADLNPRNTLSEHESASVATMDRTMWTDARLDEPIRLDRQRINSVDRAFDTEHCKMDRAAP